MRILLTNDDGIRAPGIVALYDALADARGRHRGPLLGAKTEILAIAPKTVQSATSHGVTFHTPLMTEDVEVRPDANPPVWGKAVDGRPADCVKVAIAALWPERFGAGSRPDLCISGMNMGANCGINVIYSGTVAAAIEAAFLGIPSIAVSLHIGSGKPDYERGARYARHALDAILKDGLPRPGECLNVNVPVCNTGEPDKGPPAIRVAPMNTHGLVDKYERRVSPGGDVYYWAAGDGLDFHATEKGSDVDLLFERCTTVTPLRFDLTRHEDLTRWRERLG
ncbi:MAG: 5'/3'-nucleotidase SurE [Phycisphaeraceae bacterium]|nr:5'/3'-nucleotidase SurE [Phycisphaeraceae bacterium]